MIEMRFRGRTYRAAAGFSTTTTRCPVREAHWLVDAGDSVIDVGAGVRVVHNARARLWRARRPRSTRIGGALGVLSEVAALNGFTDLGDASDGGIRRA